MCQIDIWGWHVQDQLKGFTGMPSGRAFQQSDEA
jgi:hypothetical protein